MKVMIFIESVIWTRRLYPKVFQYGFTAVVPCKPSVCLRTSLVHALKCLDTSCSRNRGAHIAALLLEFTLVQDRVLSSVVWLETNRIECNVARSACRWFECIYFQEKLDVLSLSCRW